MLFLPAPGCGGFMDNKNRATEISAESFWKVLLQRWWILLLVGAISFGAMFLYSTLTFTPKYESKAEIYILYQGSEDDKAATDYQVSLLIVKDCTYMLKSRKVIDTVIANLQEKYNDMDYLTYAGLVASISTNNPEELRFLEVSVKAKSNTHAKLIIDELCAVGVETINDNMRNEEQAHVYSLGTLPGEEEYCNSPSPIKMLLISAALVALLYIVFVVIHLHNDRIGSQEEIESRLNVIVLADIPDAYDTKHRHVHYYSKYSRGVNNAKEERK